MEENSRTEGISLPKDLIDALKTGKVVPFVGAGVSAAVTDVARQRVFPNWRELLTNASAHLKQENLQKKANLVDAFVENGKFIDAAKTAKDALGPQWIDFLRSQFDPPIATSIRKA